MRNIIMRNQLYKSLYTEDERVVYLDIFFIQSRRNGQFVIINMDRYWIIS